MVGARTQPDEREASESSDEENDREGEDRFGVRLGRERVGDTEEES